jgi:endonuclease VIII-like 1
MPEIVECKIMSNFINHHTKDKTFTKIFSVEKGNIPNEYLSDEFFTLTSESYGKELLLTLNFKDKQLPIYVFMGMNGNWKYLPTKDWNQTKYVRLRLDTTDGKSLILYGGYMGPKYKIGQKFTGAKRGPDPMKDFNLFKNNVLQNLDKKDFDKPIYEVLLNQKYFNGIGNYLRSTILYYLDENPFQSGRDMIKNNPEILELCKDIPLKSYQLNGGQLRDWKNPFDTESKEFIEWVYYQKGKSIKDSNNRTFWYHPKWSI